jgi:hypothetical protein
LFEFARMAFGLCNSPATYARVVNLVLRGLNWKVVLAFWTISWSWGRISRGTWQT